MTAKANEDEVLAAQGVNMSCLTRPFACKGMCDLSHPTIEYLNGILMPLGATSRRTAGEQTLPRVRHLDFLQVHLHLPRYGRAFQSHEVLWGAAGLFHALEVFLHLRIGLE